MMTAGVRTADGVDLVLYRMDRAERTLTPATTVLLVHGTFSSHTVWMRGGARDTGLARFLSDLGLDARADQEWAIARPPARRAS